MSITLIAGLGNDESRYDLTPHNIGFHALDALAGRWGVDWREEKGRVRAAKGGNGVFLVKPLSYMNTSGPHVRWAADWRKVPVTEVLLVCDDFTLPWGRLRFRREGSSGGHNGLKSVIEAFGSQDFPRLKIGVGPVPPPMDPADYVLKRQPAENIRDLSARAADALEAAVNDGLDKAMNRYNADPSVP